MIFIKILKNSYKTIIKIVLTIFKIMYNIKVKHNILNLF